MEPLRHTLASLVGEPPNKSFQPTSSTLRGLAAAELSRWADRIVHSAPTLSRCANGDHAIRMVAMSVAIVDHICGDA